MGIITTNTKLLLHCDGSDTSTTFTDDGDTVHTMTANGNAQIDTAQSVFGGASGLFDGTGDFVDTLTHADWEFGSGEFTVEFRFRRNSTGSLEYVCGQSDSTPSISWACRLNADNTLECLIVDVVPTVYNVISTTIFNTAGVWNHAKFVRDGNTLRLFINGVQENTEDVTGISVRIKSNKLAIGTVGEWNSQFFNGWIDEVRILKGVADSTGNFTPPTTAYGSEISAIAMSLAQPVPFAGDIEIVTPAAQALTLAQPALSVNILEPVAVSEQTLAVAVLAPQVVIPFIAEASFPMLTLQATGIAGQASGINVTLPMMTVDIRIGTNVEISLPMMTLSATGTMTNGGTLAKSLPLITLEATGTAQGKGTFARSLPILALDIDMRMGGIHTFAATLPTFTLEGIGTNGGVPGTFARSLPILALSASGYNSENGTFAKPLPMLELSAFLDNYQNRII